MGQPSDMSPKQFEAAKADLIKVIVTQVAKHGNGDGGTSLDPKVLEVLGEIPREKFVPMMEQADAYANRPLPIGHRQTISQPLIVVYMTHHLRLLSDHKVLEIGTGSGYQTAVLASLANRVVTIENVKALAIEAEARLTELGYTNIHFVQGDGRLGCSEEGPFDRIIITAAAEAIPPDLIDQLAPEGRLVLPLGQDNQQRLVLVTKDALGNLSERPLFSVAFVPLTHGAG